MFVRVSQYMVEFDTKTKLCEIDLLQLARTVSVLWDIVIPTTKLDQANYNVVGIIWYGSNDVVLNVLLMFMFISHSLLNTVIGCVFELNQFQFIRVYMWI